MNLGIDGTDAILHNNTAAGSYSRVLIEALGEYCPKEHFYIYTTRVGDRVRVTPLLTYPNVRLKECKKMLQLAKAGKYNGYLLEGMACPGGCIAGAGTLEPLKKVQAALKVMMEESEFQESMDTPYVDRLPDVEKM